MVLPSSFQKQLMKKTLACIMWGVFDRATLGISVRILKNMKTNLPYDPDLFITPEHSFKGVHILLLRYLLSHVHYHSTNDC